MRSLSGKVIAILLAFAGAPSIAEEMEPTSLFVLSRLDQCLSDPRSIEMNYAATFPEESCDIATTCDPENVQAAQLATRLWCRSRAIDECTFPGSPFECSAALASRWEKAANGLSENLKVRWSKVDRSKVSNFAILRFDKGGVFELEKTCPDSMEIFSFTGLSDEQVCSLFSGSLNLFEMESLERYLISQERRE